MGKIVITSDTGGCPEMIQNNVNGFLFKKDNVENLATIFLNLLKNNNLKSISQNAHSTALDRYQSERVVGKIISFYKSILNNQNYNQVG